MIDSIDNSMAAPIRDAEGSGAVSPETDALSETAVQTEPFPPLLGEDGGFAPDWYARFDELKGMEKSLSKFKTPEALAKSYAELERLRRYPGVENEEQMARFRRLAGLPESEEEYRLERPESTPESEWNAGLAERMARTAYRYGVPPEAMNALQETMAQAYNEAREHMEDARMEMEMQAEQSLQQEWGSNYERNMGRAAPFFGGLPLKQGWMRTLYWIIRDSVPIRMQSACCTRHHACLMKLLSIIQEMRRLPPRRKPCGWNRIHPILFMRRI